RSHRMDPADRSAQKLCARHDRDESNYCQRFDRSKYRLFLRQAPEASRKQTILGLALAAGVMAMGGCFLLLSYHESVGARWLTLPPLSDGSLVEANGARISASFVLIGASLLALNYNTVGRFRPGDLAFYLSAIIAILSVVAHAHHLTGFYVSATYTPASFLTSVCFFLLA